MSGTPTGTTGIDVDGSHSVSLFPSSVKTEEGFIEFQNRTTGPLKNLSKHKKTVKHLKNKLSTIIKIHKLLTISFLEASQGRRPET
jgi:hypothetical protein